MTSQSSYDRLQKSAAAFLETAPDAIVIIGPDGRIRIVNAQTTVLFGYERSELLGQPVEMLVPEQLRTRHPGLRAGYFAEPRTRPMGTGLDLHGLRKDGTVFPAEVSLGALQVDDEVLATAVIRDLTERRKLEGKFRALLEAAPDAVVIVDRHGNITLVNSQTERLFGYSRGELVGRPLEILVPERARRQHTDYRSKYVEKPEVRAMGSGLKLFGLRKDGVEFPVEISLSPLDTEEGLLISSTIRDISDRRQVEEALRATEARSRLVLETAFEAFIEMDSRGYITEWNHKAEELFGWQKAEVVGRRVVDTVIPPALRSAHTAGLAKFFTTGAAPILGRRVEFQALRRDGQIVPVELVVSPIRTGNTYSFAAFVHDISERKQAQDVLARAKDAAEASNQELEAFSYSVSHDLRAPLRSIDGFSQALLEDSAERLDQQSREYLDRIRAATRRMASLIDALLQLAKVTRAAMLEEDVDLSELAHAVTSELRYARPRPEVTVTVQKGLVVHGDSRLLRLVLENLLDNAWKFTSCTPAPVIEVGAAHNDGVPTFFVRDNGAGFDMTFAHQLFGAFQRLHPEGDYPGTGIGLASVQRIIHRHGGRVWAEASPGRGATFFFTVPERGEP